MSLFRGLKAWIKSAVQDQDLPLCELDLSSDKLHAKVVIISWTVRLLNLYGWNKCVLFPGPLGCIWAWKVKVPQQIALLVNAYLPHVPWCDRDYSVKVSLVELSTDSAVLLGFNEHFSVFFLASFGFPANIFVVCFTLINLVSRSSCFQWKSFGKPTVHYPPSTKQ